MFGISSSGSSSSSHVNSTIRRTSSNSSLSVFLTGLSVLFTRKRIIVLLILVIIMYGISILTTPSPLINEDRIHKDKLLSDRVTVVINTFKRHDLMKESIEYYAQCSVTKYIYIIWSETDPPSTSMIDRYSKITHPKVIFNIQDVDSLNSRFKPLKGEHTDAIFTVDDDMRVPCDDLELAYETWKNGQRTLVGFMPRLHVTNLDGYLIYRCWWRVWWHGLYSIILTKAAILHHDYFDLYTNKMPQSIRDLVDKERNCEDIAMQFLISNTTNLPPIYVKGHVSDMGVLNGISTSKSIAKAGHMESRSKCLNDLTSIYGRMPLVSSHIIVDYARNGWTNVPSTWSEYISSDLWSFDSHKKALV